jgi:hypothetical protein
MSNSDIENKVYFGVHSEKSVVTDMLRNAFWIDKFVTVRNYCVYKFQHIICSIYIDYLEQMTESKTANTFICELCDFTCSKQSNYNSHLMTAKHKNRTNRTNKLPKPADSTDANEPVSYSCGCGKTYRARNSLWYHKRKCTYDSNNLDSISSNTNTSFIRVLLQQQEEKRYDETNKLRKLLLEQQEYHTQQLKEQQEQHNKQIQDLIPKLQQVTNINNTNSNNTTNNNKFNLNFFLNEQCKDAISIQTFIENLDIGIKELEHMGNVGYLQGMMTIMSNTLGAMDVYKRPVHCTDLKRETVYIKDGDTWKKDNANNDDLRRVINTVANVNYRNLDVWESQHPDAFESDTPDNIEYCKIAMESMGGYDNSDDKIAIKLNKLVKHVVREVYVK